MLPLRFSLAINKITEMSNKNVFCVKLNRVFICNNFILNMFFFIVRKFESFSRRKKLYRYKKSFDYRQLHAKSRIKQ